MARTLVLLASLGLIALIAFLTVRVALQSGLTVVVAGAVLILAVLTIGVLGALTDKTSR